MIDASFTLLAPTIPGPNVVTEPGTSFNVGQFHYGKWIATTNASAVTCNIPRNIGAFPGTTVIVEQNGAGQVTFTPATGVTIQARGYTATCKTNAQWSPAMLTYKGQDVWNISGDITVT